MKETSQVGDVNGEKCTGMECNDVSSVFYLLSTSSCYYAVKMRWADEHSKRTSCDHVVSI